MLKGLKRDRAVTKRRTYHAFRLKQITWNQTVDDSNMSQSTQNLVPGFVGTGKSPLFRTDSSSTVAGQVCSGVFIRTIATT